MGTTRRRRRDLPSRPARPLRSALLVAVLALIVAGCGGGDGGDGGGSGGSGGGGSEGGGAQPSGAGCEQVLVPGHIARELRATEVACPQAQEVAAAAAGRGRQRYEAGGFVCRPSEAGGGDTNYACSRDGARITFRYGVR